MERVLYYDNVFEGYFFLVKIWYEEKLVLVLKNYFENYFYFLVVYKVSLLFEGGVEWYEMLELEDI